MDTPPQGPSSDSRTAGATSSDGATHATDGGPSEPLKVTAARIEAAARQQRSRSAYLEERVAGWPVALEAVRLQQRVAEPSFQGGGLVAWAQKVVYHLFSKRAHRTLLEQQNEFNRQVSLALRELWARQDRLESALQNLEAGPMPGSAPDSSSESATPRA